MRETILRNLFTDLAAKAESAADMIMDNHELSVDQFVNQYRFEWDVETVVEGDSIVLRAFGAFRKI